MYNGAFDPDGGKSERRRRCHFLRSIHPMGRVRNTRGRWARLDEPFRVTSLPATTQTVGDGFEHPQENQRSR